VSRWFSIALLVAAVSAGGWGLRGHRLAAEAEFHRERMGLLESENARLRALVGAQERARASRLNTAARGEIERAVSQLRGLGFKTPVAYDVVTRETILAALGKKLAEQYSEADLGNLATGYAALGLLPEKYPLRQKFLDLLGEQVAAFYDQTTHRLFMFADADLGGAQNRVILAHELVHALQDQHFSLKKLPLDIKDNDDLATATAALVEGDATIVMNQFAAQSISLNLLVDSLGGLFTQNTAQLQAAPRLLRETLLFPYVAGMVFCQAVLDEGGPAALDRAYASPPVSTSQILHPERYLADPRETPVRIAWPDTAALGQRPLLDNVLGELGTRILLSEWGEKLRAAEVAAGWRGDRFLVFDGGRSFFWKSVWRTPPDADKFMEAARAGLNRRHGAATARDLRIRRISPTEVGVTDAASREWADALEGEFSKTETDNK
jgi:hypothetical protein